MRGIVDGLPTPYPLSAQLPAFLQEDEFAVRYLSAFDAVLAPVISVLDCLEAYVDPQLAPDDFVPWLADWVGASLDGHWTDQHRRATVLRATALHRARGTVAGLRAQLELATGGQVEIIEPGGAVWALLSGEHDDEAPSHLLIRVHVDDPGATRPAVLEELVDAVKPAHLPHTIEVMQR